MPTYRIPACLAIIGFFVLGVSHGDTLWGQEFRIDSQVLLGDSEKPVSRNITLYTPKLVFDYLVSDDGEPKIVEIVIFDTRLKTMVLIDPVRKIRTEVQDMVALRMFESLRQETLGNEKAKFLLTETFQEKIDLDAGELTLQSPTITYRVKGAQPSEATMFPPYADFVDHLTRMMATDATRLPPFARARLNQTIKKLGWIPTEVHLSIRKNALFPEALAATSRHELKMGLADSDRKMMEKAKKYWMEFPMVKLARYRGVETPPTKVFQSENETGGDDSGETAE